MKMYSTITIDEGKAGEDGSYTSALVANSDNIYVGGTLTVDAAQAAGVYEGDVVVTVNYN